MVDYMRGINEEILWGRRTLFVGSYGPTDLLGPRLDHCWDSEITHGHDTLGRAPWKEES